MAGYNGFNYPSGSNSQHTTVKDESERYGHGRNQREWMGSNNQNTTGGHSVVYHLHSNNPDETRRQWENIQMRKAMRNQEMEHGSRLMREMKEDEMKRLQGEEMHRRESQSRRQEEERKAREEREKTERERREREESMRREVEESRHMGEVMRKRERELQWREEDLRRKEQELERQKVVSEAEAKRQNERLKIQAEELRRKEDEFRVKRENQEKESVESEGTRWRKAREEEEQRRAEEAKRLEELKKQERILQEESVNVQRAMEEMDWKRKDLERTREQVEKMAQEQATGEALRGIRADIEDKVRSMVEEEEERKWRERLREVDMRWSNMFEDVRKQADQEQRKCQEKLVKMNQEMCEQREMLTRNADERVKEAKAHYARERQMMEERHRDILKEERREAERERENILRKSGNEKKQLESKYESEINSLKDVYKTLKDENASLQVVNKLQLADKDEQIKGLSNEVAILKHKNDGFLKKAKNFVFNSGSDSGSNGRNYNDRTEYPAEYD